VGPSVQYGAGDNRDPLIIRGFGREWSNFRQDADHLSHEQRQAIFDDYFRIFPWYRLPPGGGVGLDIGCGKRALVDVDCAARRAPPSARSQPCSARSSETKKRQLPPS